MASRAQLAFQLPGHGVGQLREVAIEVAAAGEFEAALMGGLEHLPDADGIRHRHQFDHPGQATLIFQFAQAALELDGNAHARQFVGMQGSLDVSLARTAAESKQ